MTKTTTIFGHRVRTASTRRYVIFVKYEEHAPSIYKRSDAWATIKAHAAKAGGSVVIWDTVTGEHFDWAGRPLG
jgi:hypothetical protein